MVERRQSPNPSLRPLGEALQGLVALEPNWDSYGASPPSAVALERAWHLASGLVERGLPVPQVVPTRTGGIQLEWHLAHVSLEWETDPNGLTGVFLFDDFRTGEKVDGDLPAMMPKLIDSIIRIWRG